MSKARVCGVANIPNQIHNVASHTHFNFNVLLMGLAPPRCFADRECLGEMSVGKTAFMNRVLNQPIFTNELFPFFEQCKGREVGIRIREQYCIENDTHATIRLIDAPQVGYSVRKAAGLSEQDLISLKNISALTNVLIVASKADMLTEEEQKHQAAMILFQCEKSDIELFDSKVYPITNRPNARPITDDSLEKLLLCKFLPQLFQRVEDEHYENYREKEGHKICKAGLSLPLGALDIQ